MVQWDVHVRAEPNWKAVPDWNPESGIRILLGAGTGHPPTTFARNDDKIMDPISHHVLTYI
jgi:hypothetical protein